MIHKITYIITYKIVTHTHTHTHTYIYIYIPHIKYVMILIYFLGTVTNRFRVALSYYLFI